MSDLGKCAAVDDKLMSPGGAGTPAAVPFPADAADALTSDGAGDGTAAVSVWVVVESLSGGPDYSVVGVFSSREAAVALLGGAIHPGAGKQESAGGIGWTLPDGGRAWEELEDGDLLTFDASIERWDVA